MLVGGARKSAKFGTIMLFSDRLSEQEMLEAKGANRQALLDILLNDFRTAFPDLTFKLELDFPIINAQAFGWGDKRVVAIYGGLALNPKLGAESLAFIILHEVGHHLAKGCRSKRDRSLACECASDYWAVTVGTDTLLQKSGRRLQLRTALEELDQIMSPRQVSKDGYTKKTRYTKMYSISGCWTRRWHLRSRALSERTPPPMIEGFCITYI
jgi:peptidase M48-like protein